MGEERKEGRKGERATTMGEERKEGRKGERATDIFRRSTSTLLLSTSTRMLVL